MTTPHLLSFSRCNPAMAPLLAAALAACGGSSNEFSSLAKASGDGRVRALAVTTTDSAVINRYDFSSGVLALPLLQVVDGSSTACEIDSASCAA